MPRELTRLQTIIAKALAQTAHLWPQIRIAYSWLHEAVTLLNNKENRTVWDLRCRYRNLLGRMGRHRHGKDLLGEAATQFRKVSKSYWNGLFACYQRAHLPRTNNELEQQFGSFRHAERRISGRKCASPMTVVRGSVRLVAGLSTPKRLLSGSDLRPRCLEQWRTLRNDLKQRHQERSRQRQFRKDPKAYLARLEQELLTAILPT